ncbi:MAG: hypothetical protein NTAFB01_36890 [Nitrospira sp.]
MLVLKTGTLGTCGFSAPAPGAPIYKRKKRPLFPPAIMKDVEVNTFDAKTWEDQAYHPSSAAFVPHKSVLRVAILVPRSAAAKAM